MTHQRNERGFTLIELMISVTLVAAIATGMLWSMRTSLLTLEKVDARLDSNRREVSVEQILSRELQGVMPVTGECRSFAGGIMGHTPAFMGTEQSLVLVSSYSMAEGARGFPRVLQYQVVPSDRGGVRLIVNESLYTGPTSLQPVCLEHAPAPAFVAPQSFILADRLAYCRIAYQEYLPITPAQQHWLPFWNRPDLPAAIHIDMRPLIPDPASLPQLSATVPIHVTRQVQAPYADY